jgi:hypothetical protein
LLCVIISHTALAFHMPPVATFQIGELRTDSKIPESGLHNRARRVHRPVLALVVLLLIGVLCYSTRHFYSKAEKYRSWYLAEYNRSDSIASVNHQLMHKLKELVPTAPAR